MVVSCAFFQCFFVLKNTIRLFDSKRTSTEYRRKKIRMVLLFSLAFLWFPKLKCRSICHYINSRRMRIPINIAIMFFSSEHSMPDKQFDLFTEKLDSTRKQLDSLNKTGVVFSHLTEINADYLRIFVLGFRSPIKAPRYSPAQELPRANSPRRTVNISRVISKGNKLGPGPDKRHMHTNTKEVLCPIPLT